MEVEEATNALHSWIGKGKKPIEELRGLIEENHQRFQPPSKAIRERKNGLYLKH